MALIIDGKAIAQKVRAEAAQATAALKARGVTPGLAVVLVGDDAGSQIYVRNKEKACAEAGIAAFDHRLPATTPEEELYQLVLRLNADPAVDGILVQLPLPAPIDSRRILEAVSPDKDVDGFHPVSIGRLWMGQPGFVACTPAGIMRLLAEAQTPLAGVDAVVVGRSNIVGKPMAALLQAANATVTMCHSKTRDLPGVIGRADVVVAAIGKPELIRGAWIKAGATVIDVGMNRLESGKLMGDVEFAAAAERARAITPVPGGVGPMTIAMLLGNTVAAAARRAARRD
ncbi:MAG TPA: bifunctional methylenetetrahydrofolate dehydrogenase/methenyltetrahydrofolate cyclohydrolase FolD [Polyangia bacterium]|jgi:methylenetetrahydrofolate dehydrogenase (NADP+)/methenyltetrahydrofolate cyclohydrolase